MIDTDPVPIYSVSILPRARKELDKIRPEDQLRVAEAIKALGYDPRPVNCKKLRSRPGWRIRIGDYRVLYVIKDDVLVVIVFQVGHRHDVYE